MPETEVGLTHSSEDDKAIVPASGPDLAKRLEAKLDSTAGIVGLHGGEPQLTAVQRPGGGEVTVATGCLVEREPDRVSLHGVARATWR